MPLVDHMEASCGFAICPLLSLDEAPRSSLESSFRFAASREASAITMTASAIRDAGRQLAQRTLENLFSANYEPGRPGSRTAFLGVEAAKNNEPRLPLLHARGNRICEYMASPPWACRDLSIGALFSGQDDRSRSQAGNYTGLE